MKKYNVNSFDFTSYKNIANNSLQFENMCTIESFDTNKDKSRLGLLDWSNELLTIYLPSIIDNGNLIDIRSEENQRRYSMNPHRLSKDKTGITDYWYLILAMNSYRNIYEFKDFTTLILFPNTNYVDSLITVFEKDRLTNI